MTSLALGLTGVAHTHGLDLAARELASPRSPKYRNPWTARKWPPYPV